MADTVKISALPLVTSSSASDDMIIVQGGVTSRIHPGAGGGLAADSVPDCGIGAAGFFYNSVESWTAHPINGGFCFFGPSTTGLPSTGYWKALFSDSYGGDGFVIVVNLASDAVYVQRRNGWAWSGVWNCLSDGLNAGQPPAPRPTSGTPAGGANGPGKVIAPESQVGVGNIYYSGLTSKTGTWKISLFVFNTATGMPLSDGIYTGSGASVISAGNASYTYKINAERVS